MLQGLVMYGQTGTSSPYARFGYGSLDHVGFGKNQGMGGLGIAVRSNANLSPLNPASYSAIDSLSQIFEIGVQGSGVRYEDARSSSYKTDMNFNYLGVGVPVSRWWGMGFGITPMSSVGYDFGFSSTIDADTEGEMTTTQFGYTGNGGVSQAFWGNSFMPVENLSIGVNMNFYFGSLNHYRSISFPDETYYFGYVSEDLINIKALHFSYGVQYEQPLNDKQSLIFGAVYEGKKDLNAHQNTSHYRRYFTTSSRELIGESSEDIEMELPQSYGVGLNYVIHQKLEVGAEYYVQNFGNAKYYGTDSLQNRQRVAVGLEYTPNYLSPKYFNRVKYRLGANLSNSYQGIYDEDIYNLGITFGLGIPLGYSKTTINLAFEYGKRGTTDNDLVREDYLKFVLNLSLNDVWFVQRKFK